jgi:hypothetical protein
MIYYVFVAFCLAICRIIYGYLSYNLWYKSTVYNNHSRIFVSIFFAKKNEEFLNLRKVLYFRRGGVKSGKTGTVQITMDTMTDDSMGDCGKWNVKLIKRLPKSLK